VAQAVVVELMLQVILEAMAVMEFQEAVAVQVQQELEITLLEMVAQV
jgi:hypothetical protein